MMLKRRTPLLNRTPIKRGKRIRQRRAEPRDRGELSDEPRLAWLRTRPCRGCGSCPCGVAHHLRHDERGASLGAHVKDDRRAISLCWRCHGELHANAGQFSKWTNERIQAWEDEQLAAQRAEWERHQAGGLGVAMAF